MPAGVTAALGFTAQLMLVPNRPDGNLCHQ
jgi:hypothetical protein